jgi:RNA-directed DNA polymerase
VQFAVTVPTVMDRFIQQAVMQVLQKQWDRTFSDHSYGFRPGRSAHQAVAQAQQYIAEGHGWCIDLDLEKFFDTASYYPRVTEKTRLLLHDFDSQALTSSLSD